MCFTVFTTMCFTVFTTMLTTMYPKSFPREIHCRTHQPEFRQQWKRPLRIGSQKFTSNKTQFVKLACLLSIFLRRALLINTVGSKSLSFDICCTKIHLHNIFYNWGHFCKPTLFQNIYKACHKWLWMIRTSFGCKRKKGKQSYKCNFPGTSCLWQCESLKLKEIYKRKERNI